MQPLDPAICQRARLSRDRRFDGEFFLAVITTGIYCRPICPARPPRECNVRYFRSAAEAVQQGFRPCLRCRPESAPHSPAWCGSSTTLRRALQLIQEGFLNRHHMQALSERLGVGERYLRKLFRQQLGASPSAIARTQRIHFARKLLLETALPITEIAHASGFGSLRRFNSVARHSFGCAPRELRKGRPANTGTVVLELSYRPPYDWDGVLRFFRHHSVAGLESVEHGSYYRNLRTASGGARIQVSHRRHRPALLLSVQLAQTSDLMAVVATVRRMFDLDAQPRDIRQTLAQDGPLKPLLRDCPGVRSPVVASSFEAAVRTVLGQQVSLAAARQLCAKLLRACGNHIVQGDQRLALFPTPPQLAALAGRALPMPTGRRHCLRALCHWFAQHPHPTQAETMAALAEIKGVGPWTLAMIGMRGFGDPDSFPGTDLGLIKAWRQLPATASCDMRQQFAAWQPWRSYAANLLWRNLAP